MTHSNDSQIISELKDALQNLHDACKFWEDQNDSVLANARKALEKFKNLQNGLEGFSCPSCSSSRVEEVLTSVTVSYEIIEAESVGDEDPYLEYGYQYEDGGDFNRYQCQNCGHEVKWNDDEGKFLG